MMVEEWAAQDKFPIIYHFLYYARHHNCYSFSMNKVVMSRVGCRSATGAWISIGDQHDPWLAADISLIIF